MGDAWGERGSGGAGGEEGMRAGLGRVFQELQAHWLGIESVSIKRTPDCLIYCV